MEDLVNCFADIIDNPDKGFADVTFKVADRRFGGLRKVLSSRCAVFNGMFNRGFKEAGGAEEVSLSQSDDAAGAFRSFLIYIHAGQASFVDLPVDLHRIADCFGVEELKIKDVDIISEQSLTLQNAFEILGLQT